MTVDCNCRGSLEKRLKHEEYVCLWSVEALATWQQADPIWGTILRFSLSLRYKVRKTGKSTILSGVVLRFMLRANPQANHSEMKVLERLSYGAGCSLVTPQARSLKATSHFQPLPDTVDFLGFF